MHERSSSRRWVSAVVGCALLACLGVSLALASRGGPAPKVLGGHTVTFGLNEYSITPQAVSVPAGPLRIVAQNRGILAHNLTVEDERLDSNGEHVIVATTHTISPGSSRTISTGSLAPGRYLLSSTISNQADLGMTGTLVVR
jgi:uncharacterized cupredoxin-like copper-binding protein